MPRSFLPFVFLALASPAAAQLTHVIPDGMANAVGASSNAFPWGTAATSFPGLRILACYDSTNFTNAQITAPILITGLRWRADNTSSNWAGGHFLDASVSLSTAAVDVSGVTTNWAANHGPDLTLCYSGPVTVQPGVGNGGGVPGPYHVALQLTTPFLYDPQQGDLCIDTDFQTPNFAGNSLVAMDIDNTPGRASRVYGSTQYPSANGTSQNHGIVVEVSYLPTTGGTAVAAPYGAGCYDVTASFYEAFVPNAFDLGNSGLTLAPTATGYVVVPGASAWYTPTSTPLSLANDAVAGPFQLGFPLAYPGGSATQVRVSSNGFVRAGSSADSGCCFGNPIALLQGEPRWCPLWTDLDPSIGGTVQFDTDPQNGAAYVTFTNVPEAGTANVSTFQLAFFSSGIVEYRYQACAVGDHIALTGWSPGGGGRDPGPVDLSTAVPIQTGTDASPLQLTAAGRPILGTGVVMTASNVPVAAPVGVFVGGLTQQLQGLDLGAIGMPGCRQHLSLDAALAFVPAAGAGSFTFQVPNLPALSGVHVYLQAAVVAAGVNALGVLTSNGVDLLAGMN